MSNSKVNISRYSYYSALAWVDSCTSLFNCDKSNIIDLLTDSGYEIFLSPEHNNDLNDDGNIKKNHRHLIFHFSYSVTSDKAREIIESFGFQFGKNINSVQGAFQYFIHLNNPNKTQYNINDIICVNASYEQIIDRYFKNELNEIDVFKLIKELIDKYNIKTIQQLIDIILIENDCNFIFKFVMKNCYFVEKYLKGGF